MNWQTMESAPKDGQTKVDLWVKCGEDSFRIVDCVYILGDWATVYEDGTTGPLMHPFDHLAKTPVPTHWMKIEEPQSKMRAVQ